MKTPENSPLRLTDQQRNNQKCLNETMSGNKRAPIQNQQTESYNTIRKYHSRDLKDHQSVCSLTQSQNLQEHEDKVQDPIQEPELSVIEEQQSVVSGSLPIRERVGHLLPAYMAANYSLEQRKIIQIQNKLDELLDYLRLHRQKTKGELFSNLKKIMRQNFEIHMDLEHFKQILYLKPDFYNFTEKKDQTRIDIMVSLPQFSELQVRKQEFRKRVYEYLKERQNFNNINNKRSKIPCFMFSFENKQQQDKKDQCVTELKQQKRNLFSKSFSLNKINPYDAFIPGHSQNFQKLILDKVRQNQARIKAQKQKESNVSYGCNQLLAIFDELPKIFKKREKCSMFKSSLIQDLDKNLNLKQQVICKVFDILLNKYPQYFKIIEHKSGQIIQIQVKLYNEIRLSIIATDPTSQKENSAFNQVFEQNQHQVLKQKVQPKDTRKEIKKIEKIEKRGVSQCPRKYTSKTISKIK